MKLSLKVLLSTIRGRAKTQVLSTVLSSLLPKSFAGKSVSMIILIIATYILGLVLIPEEQIRDIFPTLEHMWSSGV